MESNKKEASEEGKSKVRTGYSAPIKESGLGLMNEKQIHESKDDNDEVVFTNGFQVNGVDANGASGISTNESMKKEKENTDVKKEKNVKKKKRQKDREDRTWYNLW